MNISNSNIEFLIYSGKELMKYYTLVIIYNSVGFTQKINPIQEDSDFFSNQEIGEIFDSLIREEIRLAPYHNEMEFIDDVLTNKLDKNKILVWNLSRQGSDNNQKSLVTSFCDFMKIPYIGSTVYSMNLSRHKYHFQKILEATSLSFIPTYTISEFKNKKNTTCERFLLKLAKGSASRGMSDKTSNLSYSEMMTLIEKNNLKENYIIQEYIEGFEIEIPMFQIEGKFKVLGAAGIEYKEIKFFSDSILPEEMYETNYGFFNFENYAINDLNYKSTDFIIQQAIQVAKIMELKDYCRVDFRVDHKGNLHCFDISTTPYVTRHSSPNFLIEQLNWKHSDLLLMILGAFSSNTDNH